LIRCRRKPREQVVEHLNAACLEEWMGGGAVEQRGDASGEGEQLRRPCGGFSSNPFCMEVILRGAKRVPTAGCANAGFGAIHSESTSSLRSGRFGLPTAVGIPQNHESFEAHAGLLEPAAGKPAGIRPRSSGPQRLMCSASGLCLLTWE
jgi:hypothetical protein